MGPDANEAARVEAAGVEAAGVEATRVEAAGMEAAGMEAAPSRMMHSAATCVVLGGGRGKRC